MAKKTPVNNWRTKHPPRRDPIFHMYEILEGEGKSTKDPLIIFNRGWVSRVERINFKP